MSLRRRTVAVVTAVAVLAFPAAALAQSAGDNQYNDPFGSQNGSKQSSGSGGGGGGGGGSSSSGSSGQGAASGSSGSGSSGSSSASSSGVGSSSAPTGSTTGTSGSGTSSGGRQLARTGEETWLVALAGGGLLLAGVGLRLRLRGRPE